MISVHDPVLLQTALQLASVGLVAADEVGGLWLSPEAAALTGLSATTDKLASWRQSLAADDRPRFDGAFSAARAGERAEAFIGSGTSEDRRLQLRLHALPDARLLGVLSDATAVHRAERRRRELAHTLRHRTSKLIATVRTVADRTLASSETLEDFAAHFGGRVTALAHIQAALAISRDGAVDLQDLIHQELLQTAGDVSQAGLSGPDVALHGCTAELMALCLHELTVNALKFGALSEPDGELTISWTVARNDGQAELWFDWAERQATTSPEPVQRGFGFDLLERGAAEALGAQVRLSLEPGGFHCRLQLPLRGQHP